jgi:uncharacterized iron-regulated membrane protein
MPVCSNPDRGRRMRYVLQLLVPALLFAGVVYLLTRQRRGPADGEAASESRSDRAAFIAILALGALVALVAAYLLQTMLG